MKGLGTTACLMSFNLLVKSAEYSGKYDFKKVPFMAPFLRNFFTVITTIVMKAGK